MKCSTGRWGGDAVCIAGENQAARTAFMARKKICAHGAAGLCVWQGLEGGSPHGMWICVSSPQCMRPPAVQKLDSLVLTNQGKLLPTRFLTAPLIDTIAAYSRCHARRSRIKSWEMYIMQILDHNPYP